jgi:hypothetical protein
MLENPPLIKTLLSIAVQQIFLRAPQSSDFVGILTRYAPGAVTTCAL